MGGAEAGSAAYRLVELTLGQPLMPDPVKLEEYFRGMTARARWTNDGPLVRTLEKETARLLGWSESVAVSSGTAALTVALLALDLPPGAEVITTPLTFRATVLAIEAAGLRPVFAAVNTETLLLDIDATERAIGPRTGAVLPVHLFGLAADAAFDELGSAYGLLVIYDAAHAFHLEHGIAGRGAATAYSLHATKLLHTGEGGLIATNHADVADRARRIRNFGMSAGQGSGPGLNAKLPELSAAVGLSMLDRLAGEIDSRMLVRESYARAMETSTRVRPHAPGRVRSAVMEVVRCNPHHQAEILRELAERRVIARAFPALSAVGERYASTPLTGASRAQLEHLAGSVIALPIHSAVRDDHLALIAEVLSR